MTWPTVAVNTTNVDQTTDSPATARADILDLIQKCNLMIAQVSAFMGGHLADANAAAARTTLGAAASGANGDITSLAALTGAIGWGTGGGGFVTQATSKSTAVTLNKYSGVVQTNAASLAAGATVSFLLNCLCNANDVCMVSIQNGTPGSYNVWTSNNGNGVNSQTIYLKNISGGALSEALNINFAIIRVQPS